MAEMHQASPAPSPASPPPKSLSLALKGSKKGCYFWSENGGPRRCRTSKINGKTIPWKTIPAARRAPNDAPERPSEAPKTIPKQTIPAARRARNHAPERPSDGTKTTPWPTFPQLGELQTTLRNGQNYPLVDPSCTQESWDRAGGASAYPSSLPP